MTEGALAPKLLRFSLPLMVSNVLQVLFNMSDIAVVGSFAGPRALGAVGSTATLITLFTGFLIGIGGAVNVLSARCFGAKNEKGMQETVHSAFLICLSIGVLLLLAGLFFTPALLSLLGTKEELLPGAMLYLRLYLLGMPAMALYNFGCGVLSAVGDTKRPLYYLLSAGIINVLLNLLFVILFHLDEAGVALASVLSQYISAVLIIRALFCAQGSCRLHLSHLRLTPERAGALLRLGIPAGLQNAIFAIANLFIQAGVNTFDAVTVEGTAAAANADALVYDVMAAIYTACASSIGQNLGAGKRDRILKSYLICMAMSFGIGALLGVSLTLFDRAFLSLFTGAEAVLEAGRYRLHIMGFSYAFSAFMDCSIAASRGIGKSGVPTVIVILGSCVFRVLWVYTVFAYFSTIASLYLVYIFSWTITAAAEIFYFLRSYRRLPQEGMRTAAPQQMDRPAAAKR